LFLSGGFAGSKWFILLFFVAVPVFLIYEKRVAKPLIDFELLKKLRFSMGSLIVFFSYAANMMSRFQLPFFLEDVWNIPVGTAGIMLIVPAITMAIAAPLSGIISDRIGSMRVMPIALLIAIGAVIPTFFLGSEVSLPLFACFLALNGLGMGLLNTPNNSEVMTTAGREKSSYASGFLATNRYMAFSTGTAASAGIFSWLHNSLTPSFGANAAYLIAFRSIFAVVLILLVTSLIVCLIVKAKLKEQ
jgi:MFS family permease